MDANISSLPDNVSAAEARRLHAQAGHPTEHAHVKKSVPSEDAEDPLDGLREKSLRQETGATARYHERLDHAAARAAKQVETPGAKQRVKHARRAGFGSMSAAGGHAGRQAAHLGTHTKTEGLATDISADAREFEAARAGIATSSEEEEEEEEAEGPEGAEAPMPEAEPTTAEPQGKPSAVAPPELAQ